MFDRRKEGAAMEKWTLEIAAEIENAPDPEALMALLREYAAALREAEALVNPFFGGEGYSRGGLQKEQLK